MLQAKDFPAYEIGHMIIEKNGRKCSCGNKGCFEAYCSMKAIKNKIASTFGVENLNGKELYDILKKDSEEIRNVIDEFIENLNIGFSNYINIFKPEAICIGGSFVYYSDLLLNKLITRMNREKMNFYKEIPEIVVAKMR